MQLQKLREEIQRLKVPSRGKMEKIHGMKGYMMESMRRSRRADVMWLYLPLWWDPAMGMVMAFPP